jgi:selenocysteine-specific elongation factor
VRLDLADRVAGTFLEAANVVDVDAPAGIGIDALQRGLDTLLDATPTAVDHSRPRLWIDRVFAAKGAGTVVTGTLTGGTIAVNDELVVVPSLLRGRVRGLQSLKRAHERIGPGHRVAVNLSGVDHDRLARGAALVRAGQWHPTRTLDASLHVLGALQHEVSRRGAYAAYVGSGEHPVRVRLLGADAIAPGGHGHVRLHLPVPLPLVPGDRYVLREFGRDETVGGGEVLDVAPVLPASKAQPSRSVDRVVAEHGWIDTDELERLTGERRPPALEGWVVAPAALAATEARVRAAINAAGALGLDVATLDERERAVVATIEDVVVVGGRARTGTADDPLATHPFLLELEKAGCSPPAPDGIGRVELRELVRRGLVVERDGCYFAAGAVDAAARTVAGLLASSPGGVSVAQVRDALGTTRRHALPLLAHFDATGVTRRRGDLRVPGPRLPAI